jgi:hypothetical protein
MGGEGKGTLPHQAGAVAGIGAKEKKRKLPFPMGRQRDQLQKSQSLCSPKSDVWSPHPKMMMLGRAFGGDMSQEQSLRNGIYTLRKDSRELLTLQHSIVSF